MLASAAREGTPIAGNCCLQPHLFLADLLDRPDPLALVGRKVPEFQLPQGLADPQVQSDLVTRSHPLRLWVPLHPRSLLAPGVLLHLEAPAALQVLEDQRDPEARLGRSIHWLRMGLAVLEGLEDLGDRQDQA